MFETLLPPAGGDAHGDSHPPSRSTTNSSNPTRSTPDPEAQEEGLQDLGSPIPNGPATREIELEHGRSESLGSESRDAMEARRSAAGGPQVRSETAFVLPDLAKEIQLQEEIKSKRRDTELGNQHGDDPLLLDLIQRFNYPEITQDTPARGAFKSCDIPAQGLIGLIEYSYQQVATSFQEANLERTPKLSVLGLDQFRDG